MELKLSNLSKKHIRNATWPKEKKIQVVAQWLALGNLRLVAATTGVSYGMVRQWKLQPWWKEYETEIRNMENIKLDSGMTKIVERSLEVIQDRLENGDHVLNNKTGEIERRPVSMRDASRVTSELLTKRELLRGNATSRSEAQQIPIQEQLKTLAMEFAKMTQIGKGEIIDVETVEVLREDFDVLNEDDEDEELDAVHDEETPWEPGEEESTRESSVFSTQSSGATSVHEGSESSSLLEESGETNPNLSSGEHS